MLQKYLDRLNQSPEGKLWVTEYPERFTVGGLHNQAVGPDIASAATIAPTHMVHNVTGTAAIVTITPPWPGFCGTIHLIAAAIWTWTAAGNISVLGTTTAAGRAIAFTYHPALGKWHPSVVA